MINQINKWRVSDLKRRQSSAGLPREMKQGGTRLLLGPGDRLRLLSKLRIWGPIKPLINFHKCFISCAEECPDNIYFIQSSDKHNAARCYLLSWPFRDSQARSWLSRTQTDVPAEPLSHRPWSSVTADDP